MQAQWACFHSPLSRKKPPLASLASGGCRQLEDSDSGIQDEVYLKHLRRQGRDVCIFLKGCCNHINCSEFSNPICKSFTPPVFKCPPGTHAWCVEIAAPLSEYQDALEQPLSRDLSRERRRASGGCIFWHGDHLHHSALPGPPSW